MPPSSTENSLAGLIELVPQLTDDLLNHVDQPLKTQKCPVSGRHFILCDYNRDGDSYRSPWSNKYVSMDPNIPVVEDGFVPTKRLRDMEVMANQVFNTYRQLYFETGHSSVYFFNTDEKDDSRAFGACFLIHKDVGQGKGLKTGVWDSIHVFDVSEQKKDSFEYKLTTTVMVSMIMFNEKVGNVDLSGSMTQQLSHTDSVTKEKGHIQIMGKMLEEMELKIRNQIESVYIQKTREVISGMRSGGNNKSAQWEQLVVSLKSRPNQIKQAMNN